MSVFSSSTKVLQFTNAKEKNKDLKTNTKTHIENGLSRNFDKSLLPHKRKLSSLLNSNKTVAKLNVTQRQSKKPDFQKRKDGSKIFLKKFDIRKNHKYRKELNGLYKLSKKFSLPLLRQDFAFLKYYKKLMRKKLLPLRWPIYRIPYEIPAKFTAKRFYLKRKQWKILFGYKIRLIKIYHNSCSRWFMKRLLANAPLYKQRMREFKTFFPRMRTRYLPKKWVKPEEQKKYYINQKFNKKFKLFKFTIKKKNYDKYHYQLKLLQNQFIQYLQLTPYFYKQLAVFYKQFSFSSNYEKFFLILHQRVVIVLHKLRYFSPFFVVIPVYYKLLKSGLILINGKIISSPYNCVWLHDNITAAYKLYCFEWILYKRYNQLKWRFWNGNMKKKMFTSKNYKPYIFSNRGRYKCLYQTWVASSKRINASIITALLTRFWRKKLLPRFYNYINLQIISELLPYKTY